MLAFDRLYLRDQCLFLFLQVLRCFSSLGSLPTAYTFDRGRLGVTPARFPDSDISGSTLVCQIPGAFRRLPRLSSPLDAKTSTMYP